jgi:hypothetical protein
MKLSFGDEFLSGQRWVHDVSSATLAGTPEVPERNDPPLARDGLLSDTISWCAPRAGVRLGPGSNREAAVYRYLSNSE